MEELVLVPKPKKIRRREGAYSPPAFLERRLAAYTLGTEAPKGTEARIDPARLRDAQSYRLEVTPDGASVVAGGKPGMFYGLMTLRQLIRQADATGRVPCLRIDDYPQFPVRGVMLDISRDRVPTMKTIKGLIDLWAELKYNQVQLYTEHTFAYPSHEVVWKNASPVTPREAEDLDRYCADRAIELVPNQNSFGHMERWLEHAPYSRLAEATGSYVDPWGGVRRRPTTLNPLDPQSLELLTGLYGELLPHFSAAMINVGADEPFELGQGRSREVCERIGVGRVYLEFMLKIHGELARRGRIMQFYGDIILLHPELIKELPRDVIALDWGYEADHPFGQESRSFAQAGLGYYVCPGTSSWNSLGGRWPTARQNILSAAREGADNAAAGMLLTDWGDNGHWQQLPVSYPGYLLAAAAAWDPDTASGIDIRSCLSRHIFRDTTGNAAAALMKLADPYDRKVPRLHNSTMLAVVLLLDLQPYHEEQLKQFAGYDFTHEQDRLEEAVELLKKADMRSEDARTLNEELRFTADLMAHAARLGRQRFATPDLSVRRMSSGARKKLAAELETLSDRFQELWLIRSRRGGLTDSVACMSALKDSYLCG